MLRYVVFSLLGCILSVKIQATSVVRVDHDCPICGQAVQTMELASYSQWGEQPRNLSSMMNFGMGAAICPYDLYCARSYRWKECDEAERKKIRPVLEKGVIELTDHEKTMAAKHGDSFFDDVKELLWLRTCNRYRQKDLARDLRVTLSLYYNSYETPLRNFYRTEAIERLDRLPKEGWIKDEWLKMMYAYLRAELLREAGAEDESVDSFNRVLVRYEVFSKKTKDNKWVSHWSKEQLTRIKYSKLPSDKLKGTIIEQFPNPRVKKDMKGVSFEQWMNHRVALDILLGRVQQGEAESGQVLYEILNEDEFRLIALLDQRSILIRNLARNESMKAWMVRLKEDGNAEVASLKLNKQERDDLVKKVHKELGVNAEHGYWAIQQTLIPAFEKWRKSNLSQVDVSPLPEGWTWQQGLDGYYYLMTDLHSDDPARKLDAMRGFLMILPQVPEKLEKWSYDLSYGLTKIADKRNLLQQTMKELLHKSWKSSFWKNSLAYLVGQYKAEDLAKDPSLKVIISDELKYEKFLWNLFASTKDTQWKERALRQLEGKKWVASSIYFYLGEMMTPAMIPLLKKRIDLIRKGKGAKGNEMYEYELHYAQDLILHYHFKKLIYSH